MQSLKILLFVALSLREVSGAGCHGASRFRVEPAHTEEIASRSNNKLKLAKEGATTLTAKEQDEYCAAEYGEGSKLFDLVQMKGEFENPEDLQHALLPLFQVDPKAMYFVANDGDIVGPNGVAQRLVLVLVADNTTIPTEQPFKHRVAGPVFMESLDMKLLDAEHADVQPLCNIPKPKYESGGKDGSGGGGMDTNNMQMPFARSSSTSSSSKSYTAPESSSSSSSWGMSFLGVITAGAVCVAALQTWKARAAASAYMTNPLTQSSSIDLGGSYSVLLSSEENGLSQELTGPSH